MQRILSEKWREHILLNGICYRLDSELRNKKESQRCTQDTCRGRMHVNGSSQEEIITHTNVPQSAASAMKKMVSNLRERASSSNDVPRRIIQESQVSLPDETTILLPKYTSLQRSVQRRKKRDGDNSSTVRSMFKNVVRCWQPQLQSQLMIFARYLNLCKMVCLQNWNS